MTKKKKKNETKKKKTKSSKSKSGHLRVRRKKEADLLKKYKKRIRKYKRFQLEDGTEFKTVYGLCQALKEMDQETFNHHVSDDRNDFYNWISDVFFRDKKLAKEIKKNDKNPKQMREAIISRIFELIDLSF